MDTTRATDVVLTFVDRNGHEWLAAAVMTPLRRSDGEQCLVTERPDRAFVLKNFTVVTQ